MLTIRISEEQSAIIKSLLQLELVRLDEIARGNRILFESLTSYHDQCLSIVNMLYEAEPDLPPLLPGEKRL